MILECPNCQTSYEIPVELPPEGRKVRCASCLHIWTATSHVPPKPVISMSDFEDEEIVFKEEGDAPQEPVQTGTEPAFAAETAGDAQDSGADTSASAIEEVFGASIDEAAEAQSEFGQDEDEDSESPPIVIGKARKLRRPMLGNVAAGWAALALFLAGTLSIAYFQRVNVVRALPGAAPAYERIGLPVNVRGLEFAEVKYSWETSAGRPVLEVFGDIVNVTSKPLKVPTVVFGLRTKEKVEVYQWAADVRSELLPAGKKTAFSAQIPTPPKSIRDVQVRFAKVR